MEVQHLTEMVPAGLRWAVPVPLQTLQWSVSLQSREPYIITIY
jgi:hypothetical protein